DGNPAQDITALRRVVFVMSGGHAAKTTTTSPSPSPSPNEGWQFYGGDPGAMKYSSLTTINRSNVSQLQPAWEWQTGEKAVTAPAARPGDFQATPIVINDTMYLSTPFNRVVALDANTGKQIWSYDPGAYKAGPPSTGTGFVHRGVAL